MDKEKALELFIETLRNYFKARGRMIRSLMETAGQDRLSIELPALYWYYPGDKVFKKFMDLYRYLIKEYNGVIEVLGEQVKLEKDRIIIPKKLITVMIHEER
ncbi:hypothetical protein J4526_08270 [Desulfurococcaceae archaeon MEX13E-LK6-19]|nr:hypothetical protein J4526_08270 [Desulfurococcaceae archaeon MEX13E-LK6-19]